MSIQLSPLIFRLPFRTFFVLSGVYLFFLHSAIYLHFFPGVFLHFIIGANSGKALPELKASLEVIRNASSGLIKDIEKNYAELAKDKGYTQTQEEAVQASGMPESEEPKAEEGTAEPPAPEQPQEPAQDAGMEAPDTLGKLFEPESIYKVRQNPYSDSPGNSHILQEYVTQESRMAKLGDILYIGTMEECQKLLGRLEAGELTQRSIKELNQGKFQKKGTAKSPDRKTPEEHPEGRPSVIGRLQSAKGAASGQGRNTRRQYKNRFNDFQQNTYDFDALEKKGVYQLWTAFHFFYLLWQALLPIMSASG